MFYKKISDDPPTYSVTFREVTFTTEAKDPREADIKIHQVIRILNERSIG